MTGKERNYWVIGALVTLLALVGAYLGVVGPQLSQRAETAAAAETASQAAAAAAGTADDLQAKAAQIEDAIDRVNRLASSFPNDYKQGEWLNMMYDAADAAAVRITVITPTVPADPATTDASGVAQPVPPPVAQIPGQPAPIDPATGLPATPVDPATGLPATPVPATGEAVPSGEFAVAASAVHLEVRGPAANLIAFLAEMEKLERPILLTNLEMAGEGDQVSAKLDGTTYLTRPLEVPEQFR